jgi:hypothetical protein
LTPLVHKTPRCYSEIALSEDIGLKPLDCLEPNLLLNILS